MARWGKMTARGCYTLTKELKRKLRDVANGTQLAESKHVRNALTLYVPYYLPPEPKKNGDEDERGGFLRFMSRIACLLGKITHNPLLAGTTNADWLYCLLSPAKDCSKFCYISKSRG